MGCNCNNKKYSISMGCCEPVLGPIENYYTKYQIDKMFDEVESAITSGCCITPEEVDEKIDEATSGLQETLIAGDNITISGNVISASASTCDLSDYVTYDDLPDFTDYATKQWVNNQNFASNSELIQYITNLQNQIDSLSELISGCCGSHSGETEYRWITMTGENDYTCSGTTKMTKEKEQSSNDGLNWTDTGNYRSGDTILEENSIDCGYIPYSPKKVVLQYVDGTSDVKDCDGSTRITFNELPKRQMISSATIGDCVTSIGGVSFAECADMVSISLSSGLTEIESSAFDTCSSLTNITIPNTVTYIGTRAFANCSSLSSITLSSRITIIENSMLLNCTSLVDVIIPENVISIGISGFSNCTSLTSINIPSGVSLINTSSFDGCRGLTSITVNALTPPTLGNNVFTNTNGCVIYVPSESVEAYKSANKWSDYASRIQAIQ